MLDRERPTIQKPFLRKRVAVERKPLTELPLGEIMEELWDPCVDAVSLDWFEGWLLLVELLLLLLVVVLLFAFRLAARR